MVPLAQGCLNDDVLAVEIELLPNCSKGRVRGVSRLFTARRGQMQAFYGVFEQAAASRFLFFQGV